MSKIEWTNKTWNPVVGCSKVSTGCKNCYAIRMAWRLQHIGHSAGKYAGTVEKTAGGQLNWTGKIGLPNIHDEPFSDRSDLLAPLAWKKAAMVFVNSMSDLFHKSIPFEVIDCIFAIMAMTPQHTYQVLTKRPARMKEYLSAGKDVLQKRWITATHQSGLSNGCTIPAAKKVYQSIENGWPLSNIWLGVSVEHQQAADERIPLLLQVPAAVRFLSCEPLLGPLDLMQDQLQCKDGSYPFPYLADKHRTKWLHNIDWLICGGESGHGARPMHPDWVRKLRDQCEKAGTAFFFKQWGMWKPFCIGDSRKPDYGTFKNNPGDWNDSPVGTFLLDVLGLDWGTVMTKVGKTKAGRQLDGREWNEFPGKKTVAAEDPDLATGGFDY